MRFHFNVYGAFRTPQKDLRLAKFAADAGFEGIWIGEHFHPWIESRPFAHHAFSWLTAALANVPDVVAGTSVSFPCCRFEPPVLAQHIATTDQLYPGRFQFGVGTGEYVNEAGFIEGPWPSWDERAGRLVESLEIMTKLWTTNDYIDYEGEFYEYSDIKLATQPTNPIDIHWAAWGPRSSECAGRYAGNVITPSDPGHLESVVRPRFYAGLAERDLDPDQGTITVEMKANVGDPDDLVAEVRDRGEYVPAKTELDNPDPRSVQTVGQRRLAEMSDAEVAMVTNISADSEYFIDILQEYDSIGVDQVIIGSTCGDPRRTISMFADEIIPQFV